MSETGAYALITESLEKIGIELTKTNTVSFLAELRKRSVLIPDSLHEVRVFPTLKKIADNFNESEIDDMLKSRR